MAKQPKVPPAAQVLGDLGMAFALHRHDLADAEARNPRDVSAALGTDPNRLLDAVLALVDDKPTIALLPTTAEVDLRALAAAVGGRHAVACDDATTERLLRRDARDVTPLAPHQHVPTVIDTGIVDSRTVFVPAGLRGVFVEVRPDDLIEATGGRTAPLAPPEA